MRKNIGWIIAISLLIIILLILPGLFMFGRGWLGSYDMMGSYGYMHGGMMGGWGTPWMFLFWLIPVGFLILVIAGGVWLGNALSNRGPEAPSALPAQTCSSCGKPTAADWKVCPHCGNAL